MKCLGAQMAIKYTESEADFKARVETITGQPFGEIKVMDIRTLADNVASWAVIYGNGYTLFRKGSYDPYDGGNTVVQELNEGGYVRVVYHAGWKDREGDQPSESEAKPVVEVKWDRADGGQLSPRLASKLGADAEGW